ncbi:endoplasmic reticulum-Golgi intermediate compartment protein 3-like isoform 1-T1 [Sarcoramphus papa]
MMLVVRTDQFSVTRHEKRADGLLGDQGLPGVFVLWELSPVMVKLAEKHRSCSTGLGVESWSSSWKQEGDPFQAGGKPQKTRA